MDNLSNLIQMLISNPQFANLLQRAVADQMIPQQGSMPQSSQLWNSPAQIFARHSGFPNPRDPSLNDLWMMEGDEIGPTGWYRGPGNRMLALLGEYDPNNKAIWYSSRRFANEPSKDTINHELSHAVLENISAVDWMTMYNDLVGMMGEEKFKSYSSHEPPLASIMAKYSTDPEQLSPAVRDYLGKFFEKRRTRK